MCAQLTQARGKISSKLKTDIKVLLISAPYIDLYGPIKIAAGRYFPLGIGYIASFLKQRGFQVILCEPEAQGMGYEEIKKLFLKEQPDVIGISSATPNFYNAVEIAKLAKSVGKGYSPGKRSETPVDVVSNSRMDVFPLGRSW